jgi:hypothetical protein
MSLIGRFLCVEEPDGDVTIYDENMPEPERERRESDGDDSWVHVAGSMDEAKAWCDDNELMSYDDGEPEDEEPRERVAQKKPCNQCPFRREAAPGWLGASDPEGFVGTMITEKEPLPCHSTVDYERSDWHERWERGVDRRNKLCAGALTLMANQGKRPRTGPAAERDTVTVFASYREFVQHHRTARVKSWEDPPKGSVERLGLDGVREYLKLPVLK